jgi:hypothetical protein
LVEREVVQEGGEGAREQCRRGEGTAITRQTTECAWYRRAAWRRAARAQEDSVDEERAQP